MLVDVKSPRTQDLLSLDEARSSSALRTEPYEIHATDVTRTVD
jgi:hypothetical protein